MIFYENEIKMKKSQSCIISILRLLQVSVLIYENFSLDLEESQNKVSTRDSISLVLETREDLISEWAPVSVLVSLSVKHSLADRC